MVNPIGSRISPLLQAAGTPPAAAPVVTPGAPAAAATPAVRAMPENKSAFTHRIKQLISFYDQYFGDELTRMGGRRGTDEIVTGWRYVFVASARALGVPSKVITAMRKPGVTLEDVIDVTFLKPNEQKAVADALVKLHSEQDEKLFGMAIRNCLKRNDLNCLWNMIQFRGSVSEDQAQDLWRQAVVTVITKPEERSREGMTKNADSLAAELFRNKSIRKDIPSALKDPAAAPVATAPGAASAAAASGASLPTAREIALLKIKTAVLKGDAVLSAPVAQAVSDESQTLKFVKEDEKKLAALKADATPEEKEKLSKALVSTKKDYAEAIVATDKAFEVWLKELQSDFDDLKKKFDEATKPEDKAEAQKAMDAKAAQLAAAKKISPVDYVASMDGWSAADVDSFRTQVQGQYDAAVKAKETAEVVAKREQVVDDVAAHKERVKAFFIGNGAYTGGPNGEFNKDKTDPLTGQNGLVAVAGFEAKLTDNIGISIAAHSSGGKTDPRNGVPVRAFYLGDTNKETSTSLGIDEAAVVLEGSPYNQLTLGAKLGLVDCDPRDELSWGKVLSLSGNTYSIAKYSPIYNTYRGACGTLTFESSKKNFKLYSTVAGGLLPDLPIGSGTKAKVEVDSDGNAMMGVEGRLGLQYVTNADDPSQGSSIAAQVQVFSSEKMSFGGYVTGQLALNSSWALQASARLFSLEGDKTDVAVYGAVTHKFVDTKTTKVFLSGFTSWLDRSSTIETGVTGTGIDVSGAALPDSGIMTDESLIRVNQLGAELVYQPIKSLKFTGVASALRTSIQPGSLEFTEWRPYLMLGATLKY